MIPLVTIAKLHARDGKQQDALRALQEVQRATHGEPGCRLYALHVDESDPRAFVMIEGWDSDATMQEHVESAYIQELIAKWDGLFEAPVDIQRLTALPYGDSGKGEL